MSIAMGRDWLKNRPKEPPKIKRPVASVPIDLDNLASGTLASESSDTITSEPPEIASGAPEIASGILEIASETASITAVISNKDPVDAAWEKISRSPFEPSPFTKMLEDAGKKAGGSGEAAIIKRKPTHRLDAPFTGLVETDRDLVAIIGGRLFRLDQDYEGKTIKKVGTQVVMLEDPGAFYVMPKKGIIVNIASDGKVDITGDSFKK